jgi:hypothetical protein
LIFFAFVDGFFFACFVFFLPVVSCFLCACMKFFVVLYACFFMGFVIDCCLSLFGCFALCSCLPCAFFCPFVVDLLLFVLVGFHWVCTTSFYIHSLWCVLVHFFGFCFCFVVFFLFSFICLIGGLPSFLHFLHVLSFARHVMFF